MHSYESSGVQGKTVLIIRVTKICGRARIKWIEVHYDVLEI